MAKNRNRNRIPKLPERIIYELLSRLPVKSLLRFRSVCKSWLSLISSRDFIKAHLSKLTNDPHFTHHQLILCDAPFLTHKYRPYIDFTVRNQDLMLVSFPVHSLLNEPITKPTLLDFPILKNMDNWTYVVDGCNGLVCLACFDGRVFLWNPSTGKSRALPEYEHGQHTVFGFGYDESKDDFKVYTVIGDGEYKVSVYSSNSNCWRMIGDIPIGKHSLRWSRGKFAHGAMHWVVSQGDTEKEIIVSLDMETETHREVLQPNYGEDVDNLALGTLGESLTVLCQYKTGADLWVVKEYGVEESWTKLFTFPIPYNPRWTPQIKPISVSANGDFMLLFDLDVIVYNNPNDIRIVFEKEENPSYNIFQVLNAHTYVESLVSP